MDVAAGTRTMLLRGLRGSRNMLTISSGIPRSSSRTRCVAANIPLGADSAAYYTTAPLRDAGCARRLRLSTRDATRLTVGAVNASTGEMRYFDSRDEALCLEHVLASGALPPAFPAVRIDGEPYWDGGLYSNTPIEAVLDDKPRKDSLIFAVQMWNPEGGAEFAVGHRWTAKGHSIRKPRQITSRARSRSITCATSSASSRCRCPSKCAQLRT